MCFPSACACAELRDSALHAHAFVRALSAMRRRRRLGCPSPRACTRTRPARGTWAPRRRARSPCSRRSCGARGTRCPASEPRASNEARGVRMQRAPTQPSARPRPCLLSSRVLRVHLRLQLRLLRAERRVREVDPGVCDREPGAARKRVRESAASARGAVCSAPPPPPPPPTSIARPARGGSASARAARGAESRKRTQAHKRTSAQRRSAAACAPEGWKK
jgi:hypothetical protein